MIIEWEVICNDEVLGDGIVTLRSRVHGGWLVCNEIARLCPKEGLTGTSSMVFVPDVHGRWEMEND